MPDPLLLERDLGIMEVPFGGQGYSGGWMPGKGIAHHDAGGGAEGEGLDVRLRNAQSHGA